LLADDQALVRAEVVLMDIRMPGTDGLEATRRIAADPELSGVRVIILTTFEEDEYVFEAIRAGASGFLIKGHRAGRPHERHPGGRPRRCPAVAERQPDTDLQHRRARSGPARRRLRTVGAYRPRNGSASRVAAGKSNV